MALPRKPRPNSTCPMAHTRASVIALWQAARQASAFRAACLADLAAVFDTTSTYVTIVAETSSGGATKRAKLETGLEILVPLFIKEGEKVRITFHPLDLRPSFALIYTLSV